MKSILALLLFLIPVLAQAEPISFDYTAFAQTPVLQDGRIKPLDSLARVMLKRIHGDGEYEGGAASQWLAFLCFNPAEAMQAPMFSLTSSRAVQMLGLTERPEHYYTFAELAAVFSSHSQFITGLAQKDKSALTSDESQILHLYGATGDFTELVGGFSLLLPLQGVDDSVRKRFGMPSDVPVTYFDIQKYRQALESAVRDIVMRKGSTVETYTPEETALTRLATHLALMEEADKDNALLRVIPPAWGGDEWLSPWGVLKASAGSPQNAHLLREWRALADGYHAKDAATWNKISQALLHESLSVMEPSAAWQIMLEYYYHRLNLLPLAACAYALGIALILTGAQRQPAGRVALLAGMVLHAAALSLRMLILMRPPVSTLYESLIFVSFVVMGLSYTLSRKRQSQPALLAGAFTALLLLFASWVFAGDSDTLGVLVAVLNTNFWLATHVVCITSGYGCALVTGAIAHIYLFRRAVNNASEAALKPIIGLLYPASLMALLFTAVGTMLGGIWADQSWGRFWGWDPKENGALLIVLWLIWVLHGRVAGQIRAVGFAALLTLLNIVVAVAWVGVNLLSVGLHSYGFTDTAANGLVAFCAAELLFVIVMLTLIRLHCKDALQ